MLDGVIQVISLTCQHVLRNLSDVSVAGFKHLKPLLPSLFYICRSYSYVNSFNLLWYEMHLIILHKFWEGGRKFLANMCSVLDSEYLRHAHRFYHYYTWCYISEGNRVCKSEFNVGKFIGLKVLVCGATSR